MNINIACLLYVKFTYKFLGKRTISKTNYFAPLLKWVYCKTGQTLLPLGANILLYSRALFRRDGGGVVVVVVCVWERRGEGRGGGGGGRGICSGNQIESNKGRFSCIKGK